MAGTIETQGSIDFASESEALRKRLSGTLTIANATACAIDWVVRQMETALAALDPHSICPIGGRAEAKGLPIPGREIVCFQIDRSSGGLRPFRVSCAEGHSESRLAVSRIAFKRDADGTLGASRVADAANPLLSGFRSAFPSTQAVIFAPIALGPSPWGVLAVGSPEPDPTHETVLQTVVLAAAAVTQWLEAHSSSTPAPGPGTGPGRAAAGGAPRRIEAFIQEFDWARGRTGPKSDPPTLLAYAVADPRRGAPNSPRGTPDRLLGECLEELRGDDLGAVQASDVLVFLLRGCPHEDVRSVGERMKKRIERLDPIAARDGIACVKPGIAWVRAKELVDLVARKAREARKRH